MCLTFNEYSTKSKIVFFFWTNLFELLFLQVKSENAVLFSNCNFVCVYIYIYREREKDVEVDVDICKGNRAECAQ